MDLKEFIAGQIKALPIEARILRKVIKAMKDAGDPIVKVWDGEEMCDTPKREDIFEIVFNLDECRIYTASGNWIFFVLGNEWDCICDYTVDIEDALKPVNDYIDLHN